ncbi:GNAT family N-acetyltransferase [Cohnella pontilimi]|uniref:GNAT family N-acetyltransferase n=1 Tax=Cohnella pontilimi TaxID=2564100 RepID=A0A4U0FK16_9BACL|nr:GNAT family N-acetyltransferase [Cohnella pontilimi]TJY43872.1 GNAT family N-acetyltransferase [Cohnella pontilimi]
MITYAEMTKEQAHKIAEIDRSETIDFIYSYSYGQLQETATNHEAPGWDDGLIRELQERFQYELSNGGMAIGAYDGELLVGFGVLGHKFRGMERNQLQVDLMYVSRNYRRKGIGTRILDELSDEARRRSAKYLYISSTETRSAVYFYKNNGGEITDTVDLELFEKEPHDIHMIKKL